MILKQSKIYDEKVWRKVKPKVDTFNRGYSRGGGDVEIFDEPYEYRIKPRIDT